MNERAMWGVTAINLATLGAVWWVIDVGRVHRGAQLDQQHRSVAAQYAQVQQQYTIARDVVDVLGRAPVLHAFEPTLWRWNAAQLDASRCREVLDPCGLRWTDEDAKPIVALWALRSMGWQLRWPVAHGVDGLSALQALDAALGTVRVTRCDFQRVGSGVVLDCAGRVFGVVAP
ncbi:MAG: hypothetical protein AAF460_04520 [Pseudomonadota bacterium]